MSGAPERLADIRRRIEEAAKAAKRDPASVTLVAVSKTFPIEDIRPVIEAGQRVFGENRVQEAMAKWPILREETPDIELHLIGPLQSNKAKEAVMLFDVIHTVDRDKIAAALAKEIESQGRHPKLLVQVNTGEEDQKAGISPLEAVAFVERCRKEHGLKIEGLMCIPPVDENPAPHFALLDQLADEAQVAWRSMGMSSDFEIAIGQGATHVRVGSAIFGHRDYPA
ncbi:pyridoxal phosphate enzyme, YggS family [Hartmannibacter diazotrophicus]|uniref:Pyridoxal phosphate homeostasis protein n=1 Tax=Hartmannibacter diazotrophicus TaxID=1482074 RepID=A0A2C9DD57_9HYPH|nr:YggS family pyridoxal phosphate-dependent enzyme [Hartmannibacter diazotrophicus]SON58173.1 pyridoxal phosphate enzyme, YggS family [Hartmannibacter diazotrophicus]